MAGVLVPPQEGTELAEVLAETARELQGGREQDLTSTADSITRAALTVVPNVSCAAITVVHHDHKVITLGATDETPVRLNRVQQQAKAGPCLTALWDLELVFSTDLTIEQRWPDYVAAALENGIVTVLSVRLWVRTRTMGALSLYGTTPGALDEDTIAVARAYAAHAAIALDQADQRERYQRAIDARDLIGQAKGILMERHRITSDAAFEMLVQASQKTNRPLRQVAERLTVAGELLAP